MGGTYKHAVVIGASLGGMCAARVLSDVAERVTVYERDALPDGPANRTAVPQGRHVHLLMARGAQEFEALYPGLLDGMVADGVPVLENRPDCIHFGAAGHVLGTAHRLQSEFTAYVPSRPQLEWQIRRRTVAIDNVDLVSAGVAEPRYDAGLGRVTGVVLDSGEQVAADLVVDATGRGTRLPAWLEKWGYERPREDTVDVGIAYASQRVQIPDGLLAEKVVVAGASRAQPLGLGMLFYEDGVWNVTTFGVGKVEPPQNFGQICDLADDIVPAHVSSALRAGTPLGEMAFHKYPTSRWRRYDKLKRLPDGIVPFGDAVVSFNPTFGQGMTMTAIQARNLRDVLAAGRVDVVGRLAKATAKTTYPVWMMTAIGDHTLHRASGPAPRWYRPVGALFDQFLGAAETDPVLAEWFLRRFSLLDSLYMVPSARLVGRTVRHNMRMWLAERRAGRQGTRDAELVGGR
jgi:2-polyprenyl-6-methoxyphenol hydroxylase-like FAD-dependent oxidoreductase